MPPGSTSPIDLVTGGTGLLGSHLAEQLVQRGRSVRALVRPASNASYLEALGAEIVRGDLNDRSACLLALDGVDTVYHAAAKVGDWGSWREFQADTVEATARLAGAARDASVRRFVQISSTSAYGHPAEGGPPIDETSPLGERFWWPWDDYTRSKVEAERRLWQLADERELPLTIIRPSWLFGERDRTTTARLVGRLRRGGIPLVGPGDNPLSAIYAGCVAEAAILAALDPGSIGEAYNITDQGPIDQRTFFAHWARALSASPSSKQFPYRAVFTTGFALEAIGKLTRRRRPPLVTRYAAWLMGRRTSYSTTKARERLGWRPSLSYQEAIDRTVRWYLVAEGQVGTGRPIASS